MGRNLTSTELHVAHRILAKRMEKQAEINVLRRRIRRYQVKADPYSHVFRFALIWPSLSALYIVALEIMGLLP